MPSHLAAITVPDTVKDEMTAHAVRELPNECCGVLLGTNTTVERCIPIRSDPPSPDAFYMDPCEQVAVFTDMERRGEQLLGIYHSHPTTPPVPSTTDLKLAFHEDVLYIIISCEYPGSPQIRAYLLQQRRFVPVDM